MPLTEVKTTYLEMNNRNEFVPKEGYHKKLEVKEVRNDWYLNMVFFLGVGLPWRWYSRLNWSPDDWDHYFQKSNSKLFLGFYGQQLIGYYELEYQEKGGVEIKFFGLLPGNYGKGLGSLLLSHAIQSAWLKKTERVWVHTCSLDSKSAIDNYLARGFKVYKEEIAQEDVPDKDQLIEMTARFFKGYCDRFSPSQF